MAPFTRKIPTERTSKNAEGGDGVRVAAPVNRQRAACLSGLALQPVTPAAWAMRWKAARVTRPRTPPGDRNLPNPMRLGIVADEGGVALIDEQRLSHLSPRQSTSMPAFGPEDAEPDLVIPLARTVEEGEVQRGIAICDSGVGAAVCANRSRGPRWSNRRARHRCIRGASER